MATRSPPRTQDSSLARRYFYTLLAALSLLIALLTMIFSVAAFRNAWTSSELVQRAYTERAAARLDNYLSSLEGLLVESVKLPWQQQQLNDGSLNLELQRLMKLHGPILWIDVLRDDGTILMSVRRSEFGDKQPKPLGETPPRNATGCNGPTVIIPNDPRSFSRPVFSIRVCNPANGLAFAAYADRQVLEKELRTVDIGEESTLAVIDAEARVVIHENPFLSMKQPSWREVEYVRELRQPQKGDSRRSLAARNAEGAWVFATGVALNNAP